MGRGYAKEDIETVFKTHFGEQSLIVLEIDKENSHYYIESAIIKISDRFLSKKEIENWVDNVPRFRDVFIHEKIDNPVRVRLKNIEKPISYIHKDIWLEEDIIDWIETQNIHFDIQKPPIFKIFVFQSLDCQYVTCCYHHLLFDGISIQQVFASLITDFAISNKEWIPTVKKTENINKEKILAFHLQNFVPPPNESSSGFLYENLSLKNIPYKDFMAKWIAFLFKVSGENQVNIGEVFSLRNNDFTAQKAFGYYVQTWPLIFEKQNSEIAINLESQRTQIIDRSDEPSQGYYEPGLFDHCWVVEPELKSEYRTIFKSKPHFLLSIVIQPNEDCTSLCFVWNLSKIPEEAAKEIVSSFKDFIFGATNPAPHVELKYELKPIIETWEEKLKLFPNKIAVTDATGKSYSYIELETNANQLASRLEINIQEPVGVRTSNSGILIVAMLAILKRRGIYVPLDPEISDERLNYILNDACITKIISDLNGINDKIIINPLGANQPDLYASNEKSSLDDICYLIYTSGTTGQPKGCAVTNSNLSNLFLGTLSHFDFNSEDRWILAHSYGFDFSTWEIWGALLNGSSLYIPERSDVKDSFKFYDILFKEKITVLNQTPKSFDNLMLVGETKQKLNALKYLIFGGDKLNIQKIDDWKDENKEVMVVNMYGITETTVHVTFKKIDSSNYSNIGDALPGYSIKILNKIGENVPNGFIGEIIVEGRGVCNGYYKKDELTSEKFNFDKVPAYKSGDLGWKMNGDFFYLGRNDRQIKIRGHRIELGEIEFLLQKKFDNLFKVLFIDAQLLVAFHTCSLVIERSQCSDILPEYANPSVFIQLDTIPLNVNGKTDEKALVAIFKSTRTRSKALDKSNLSPYIIKLLGEKTDFDKSFIENGGDSISAIRLVNSLRKDGLKISVQELFAARSINDIEIKNYTDKILDRSWINNPDIARFNQNNKEVIGIFPLTESQHGILYDSLSGTESVYFIQLTYNANKQLATNLIEKSYREVISALPALQLQLNKLDNQYIWCLPKEPFIEINIVQENSSTQEILATDFKKPFDFSTNLIRLTIVEKENDEKLLIWTHHHLLMDGWSLGIFSKMLFDSINGKIPQKQETYFNYLSSQKNNTPENINYWQSRLKECLQEPLIPFLTIGNESAEYGEYILNVTDIMLWDELNTHNLTQNHFVFSAWLAFIAVAFNKNTLSTGRVNSLREEALEDEVGMLIQTLPFPIKIDSKDTFSFISDQVKTHLIDDNNHHEIPISLLDGVTFNLDAIFVFENYPIDKNLTNDSLIKIGDVKEKTGAKLTLICYPEKKGIKLRLLFQQKLYPPEYIEQITKRFSEFIREISWNDSLEIIAKSTEKQFPLQGNTKSLELNNNLFAHFFKKQGVSLVNEMDEKMYDWLSQEVITFADHLSKLGLLQNEAVGIDVKSTKHFVISLLAIWKLGAIPCSVDNRYPEQRKQFIWKNASCRFIFNEKNEDLVIDVSEQMPFFHAENASFILHTSGSTGEPKGVIQSKDCLIHLANWTANELSLTKNERILALSSFGFDASYHELILWLELGATLIEMPSDKKQDIQEIRRVIINQAVTLAWIPAIMLNSILETDPHFFDECNSLKQLVTTGEALVIGEALQKWVQQKNIRLFNFYGPTETHVVTAKVVNQNNISKTPNIGFPISNATIGLFDQFGNPSPKGLMGEIWISGPYLAQGYLNDEALNNQKFVIYDEKRWYKSGDLGWISKNEKIEYLGRLDHQIKIRGFRVEPFEVESILHKIIGISQATIIVDRIGQIRLIAFWTGQKMTDNEFRMACSSLMPEFMIPEIQIHLDEFPKNTNGKIDRKLLLDNFQNKVEHQTNEIPITRATKCWEAVLGHSNFMANSHFQSVGGNSLKIMRMQAWLEKSYQISVSVQELLHHQNITELDALILEKENQQFFDIPNEINLNHLQHAILIAEKGNYSKQKSPFILGFSCVLPEEISAINLNQALSHLFIVYPHLSFGIAYNEELSSTKWMLNENFIDFIQQPMTETSLTNFEPLLRIYFVKDKLHVQWHHILLDAVGITIVMNELFSAISSKNKPKIRNYNLFLNHFNVKNIAKTKSTNSTPIIFERVLNSSQKTAIEKLSLQYEYSLNDFFLLLAHSLFSKNDTVGYTDNSQQIGIPGMFTFLNISSLSNSNQLKNLLQKNAEIDKIVSIVVNFIHSPELPIEQIEIHNTKITSCKYPYELQIEVYPSKIVLQLIAEIENTAAKEKSSLLFTTIDSVLTQNSLDNLFSIQEEKINVHFDDFDF